MSLLTRLADLMRPPAGPPPLFAAEGRAYVVGPSLVDRGETIYGHDDSAYQDPEYLSYIATSNNVYACIQKRATAMASLPLMLTKGATAETRKEVTTGALRSLLDSVNPWQTFDHLIHLTEQHLCLMGEAFWFLERGTSRRQPPREIWPVRPDFVRVVPSETDFIGGFLLSPPNGGEPISYKPDEVIWFAFPNPSDPYSGLAPLAAARLAADVASAAMKANKAIFSNGIQIGGVISPADSTSVITKEQANDLQELFKRGFKGASNAHRLAILDYAVKFQQWTMTPKDAEFVGAMNMTLEEIARAFGIIPELLGAGNRTFQNAPEARYAFWADTITAEARFMERVITERLLPMFPGEADMAAFNFDDVDALKENEDAIEARWQRQVADGRRTQNEWRAEQGLSAVSWGDAWWAPLNLVPILSAEVTPAPEIPAASQDEASMMPPARGRRAIAYGSPEHVAAHRRFVRRTNPWERKVAETTAALMRRQREEIIAKLRAQSPERTHTRINAQELLAVIFARPAWIKRFRLAHRPVIAAIAEDAGQAALDDLGLGVSFDVLDPNVVRAMERQAQRFATEVNQTTWDNLRASLSEGLQAGEGIDDLAARVDAVMGNRIASSAATIARTETTTAANAGTMESWRQSGQVRGKVWLCVDGDTRVSGVGVSWAARRWYVGRMVELTTVSGRVLSVTAQHPILTRRGWIAAEALHEGDDLVCHNVVSELPAPWAGMVPDVYHMPPKIAKAFNSLYDPASRVGAVSRVVDLDREGRVSEIEIVAVDRDLSCNLEPAYVQGNRQLALELTDVRLGSLLADGGEGAGLIAHAAPGVGCAGGSYPTRDRIGVLSAGTDDPGLGDRARRDTGQSQAFVDAWPGTPPLAGEGSDRSALPVLFCYDRCVRVKIKSTGRHVYDYTTKNHWMIANGLVIHNSALDDRTRDSHIEAHGQEVGIDEDFTVGGASGPGPGMMGSADEDINCRCSMTAVLIDASELERTAPQQNGHGLVEMALLARAVGVE